MSIRTQQIDADGRSPPLAALIGDARQLAKVRRRHRLRTTPHEKEHRFAAPAPGWMAEDVAGSLRRRERCLTGPQHKAIGPLANGFLCAGALATGNFEQVAHEPVVLGAECGHW